MPARSMLLPPLSFSLISCSHLFLPPLLLFSSSPPPSPPPPHSPPPLPPSPTPSPPLTYAWLSSVHPHLLQMGFPLWDRKHEFPQQTRLTVSATCPHCTSGKRKSQVPPNCVRHAVQIHRGAPGRPHLALT